MKNIYRLLQTLGALAQIINILYTKSQQKGNTYSKNKQLSYFALFTVHVIANFTAVTVHESIFMWRDIVQIHHSIVNRLAETSAVQLKGKIHDKKCFSK